MSSFLHAVPLQIGLVRWGPVRLCAVEELRYKVWFTPRGRKVPCAKPLAIKEYRKLSLSQQKEKTTWKR